MSEQQLTGHQMYIPQPMDKFLLAEPWTFNIIKNYDNRKTAIHFGHATEDGWQTIWNQSASGLYPITLPADTLIIMRCFRIKMGGGSNHVTIRIEQPVRLTISVELAEFNKLRWKPVPGLESLPVDESEGDDVAAS